MDRKTPSSRPINSHYDRSSFKLEDVKHPKLFREIFPYTEVCKTTFDNRIIPISPPENIYISDTTFRDGQQARVPYTPKQMVEIFTLIHRLGGPEGVIRQSEFFLYSDKDKKGLEDVLTLGFEYPKVTGWIRANKKDLQLVKDAGLSETGILTSCSDYHIFLKLKKTRAQVLKEYLTTVNDALDAGVSVRCHLEDITRADISGFVIPFAQELMKLHEQSKLSVKLRLCDTLGYGVPYSGAALPRSVPKLVRAMIDYAGVPGELLEWHGHNDFHKGLINASTAWLYGCVTANGTLLGFGERTGNTPIEALIVEYISLTGKLNGIDTTAITDIANYYEHEIGDHIPPNYPLVGSAFNATRAGIHADGMIKNPEIYNIFDTEKILKRPPGILINDKSGTAGIAQWINTHLRLTGDNRINKHDPSISRINDLLQDQYNKGRVTAISTEEMDHIVRNFMPHLYISEFDRIKKRALEMAEHILEAVSETTELKSMDPKRVTPVLEKVVLEHRFIQWSYVTDLEAKLITPFITQPNLKRRFKTAQFPEDFSDRSWFIQPLEDGKIHVSKFYVSYITEILCLTVSTPIFGEDDKIVGIVAFDIQFEDLVRAEDME
ncbi:MAG: histone-lysine N-methyltransferase [Spirochaetota bacterium]|nr:MAG: histone-lysine N-methyltransferase [Spirochaetota bacterium]